MDFRETLEGPNRNLQTPQNDQARHHPPMKGELHLSAFADALTSGSYGTPGDAASGWLTSHEVVNGHLTQVVYDVLSRETRREHGIFFSGATWAQRIVERISVNDYERFVDPSVGTGDLLVGLCHYLPLEPTPSKTIAAWSQRLCAIDLRESFLRLTWSRIQTLALLRHGRDVPTPPSTPLPPAFIVGDFLASNARFKSTDCILMNPPYQRVMAPESSKVGRGMRSAAALHVEHVLRLAPPGARVVALVPDVLRSGSSYKRFRAAVASDIPAVDFASAGAFGETADVDVAVLDGVINRGTHGHTMSVAAPSDDAVVESIGDHFDISVGAVVPHRTEVKGAWLPYVTARNAPLWERIHDGAVSKARFKARHHSAPFVVIRRTSSPNDRKRARATVVSGTADWYVENHLIVLKPKTGLLRDCQHLLLQLQDQRTDGWLNEHIRCRHLTVGAVRLVPWRD